MIDLPREQLQLVSTILKRHLPGCRIRAFGSRVTGNAVRFSDLDILIEGETCPAPEKLEAARDALSESDLPIMIDLVEADRLPDSLRKQIEEQATPIP